MKGREHPCPPPPAGWFSSRDDEVWRNGPLETKEDIIDEALGQDDFIEIEPDGWDHSKASHDPSNLLLTGWKAGVYVGRFQQKHIDLSTLFDVHHWLERLREWELEEDTDENGDCHPLDELTKEDIRALEESIQNTIWHWQHRRQIKLRCYWMDAVGSSEFVTVPHPQEDQNK